MTLSEISVSWCFRGRKRLFRESSGLNRKKNEKLWQFSRFLRCQRAEKQPAAQLQYYLAIDVLNVVQTEVIRGIDAIGPCVGRGKTE